MALQPEYQYRNKKLIGFTDQQIKAFKILKEYNININNFIRIAVREKIAREWKEIKETKIKIQYPF